MHLTEWKKIQLKNIISLWQHRSTLTVLPDLKYIVGIILYLSV